MTLTQRIKRKIFHILKKFGYKSFYTATPDTIPALKKAFQLTKELDGDYYEFGLFEGYSFYKAHKFGNKYGKNKISFFGFDSFEGLPNIDKASLDFGWKFRVGQYACSFEQVKKNLKSKGAFGENTHLIKGFYSDTLKDSKILSNYNFRPARVVLVDCDLYESAKEVLDFIYPFLQKGTIILFDDWNCFEARDDKGERRAMAELLEKYPSLKLRNIGDFGWHGTSFIIDQI